jgi:hypothetical protein
MLLVIDTANLFQEHRQNTFIFSTANFQTERKAQNVRQWIAAPDWTTLFDAAEKHRAACTGNWFLQQETYRDWMSQDVPESGYDMFSEQLLFISGNSPDRYHLPISINWL